MNQLAALPAGGAAIRQAQAILRRQGGVAMERAVALLDRIATDMALDAEVLARFGLPPQARRCATPIAETAAAAAEQVMTVHCRRCGVKMFGFPSLCGSTCDLCRREPHPPARSVLRTAPEPPARISGPPKTSPSPLGTELQSGSPERPARISAPPIGPALDGPLEAFLAAQRVRIARHHNTRGHVWGGAGCGKRGTS